MSPPKWTDEHGKILKDLRQKAGLDIATLARKHMVSSTQISQLENGGDSSFYNPEIKFATGKKLLQVFGHSLPETQSIATSPQITSPYTLNHSRALSTSSFSITPQSFVWVLLFLLVVLGLIGLYVDRSVKPELVPSSLPMEQIAAETVRTPSAMTETTNESEPSGTSVATMAQPLISPQTTCNWNSSFVELQPTLPRQSANYVHMLALKSVVICIKDAEERVATLELEAGKERSIYGPAPFAVYSTDLSQVKLYFQGQLVKLPRKDIQHLKLSAATR